MKTLILSALLAMGSFANASMLSCEQEIKTTISGWLNEGLVVQSVTKNAEFAFQNHEVYNVVVGQENTGGLQVPRKAQFVVLTETLSTTGACAIIDAYKASDFE
ncbi:MAG: hypothetical protein KDD34_00825 [Bdellovibrionales bacterium]|nr:hypothetical protein [Bdellovibrionales bacterium]